MNSKLINTNVQNNNQQSSYISQLNQLKSKYCHDIFKKKN